MNINAMIYYYMLANVKWLKNMYEDEDFLHVHQILS